MSHDGDIGFQTVDEGAFLLQRIFLRRNLNRILFIFTLCSSIQRALGRTDFIRVCRIAGRYAIFHIGIVVILTVDMGFLHRIVEDLIAVFIILWHVLQQGMPVFLPAQHFIQIFVVLIVGPAIILLIEYGRFCLSVFIVGHLINIQEDIRPLAVLVRIGILPLFVPADILGLGQTVGHCDGLHIVFILPIIVRDILRLDDGAYKGRPGLI